MSWIDLSACNLSTRWIASALVVVACAAVMGLCGMSPIDSSSCQVSGRCIASALALVAGGAVVGYFIGFRLATKKARVNHCVQLGCSKVVDTVDVEDIGEKKVYCRCWKSKAFPYCDGSHSEHNKETGDNVGPIIVKGTKKN